MNFETQFANDALAQDEALISQRRKRILIVVAILAAAVIAALFFMRGGEEDAAGAGGEQNMPLVTVIRPGLTMVDSKVSATGSLAARREMPVGVVGEGGQVSAVLVEPGDWVEAGQVLARVERSVQSEQSRALAASISVAQADAKLAQSELERAQALVSRGFISRADIDRKAATRDAALARVRVAQAQYEEQRARIGRLDIRAPSRGLVLTRAVEPGQVIGAGSGVLFRLAREGQMEMLARVAESELPRMRPGISATVTPVGGERSYSGEVWQVSPVVDPQSRQGTVRIALSYERDLRPGGFAAANIVAGRAEAPMLPESALLNDQRGSYVYIVNAKDEVERREVKAGQVSAKGVAIASGLSGGERVVVLAGGFLAPGQKVRPRLEQRGK